MSSIEVEQRDNVLVATITNPPYALMDRDIVAALFQLVARADRDPAIGAVVLTGAHPTRFLAHFDVRLILGSSQKSPRISRFSALRMVRTVNTLMRIPPVAEILQRTPLSGFVGLERIHQLLKSIEDCSAVWIAALNGDTGGGGCELALACDQRYMADGDYFIAQPEIFLGFVPGSGATQRLTRLLGRSKALRICLDGGPMSPRQALEIGLIDRVVPAPKLLEVTIAEASKLGRRPKHAIGAMKRSINRGGSASFDEGLRIEASEFLSSVSTPESIAAQRAYVQRMDEIGDVPATNRESVAETLERGRFA